MGDIEDDEFKFEKKYLKKVENFEPPQPELRMQES